MNWQCLLFGHKYVVDDTLSMWARRRGWPRTEPERIPLVQTYCRRGDVAFPLSRIGGGEIPWDRQITAIFDTPVIPDEMCPPGTMYLVNRGLWPWG